MFPPLIRVLRFFGFLSLFRAVLVRIFFPFERELIPLIDCEIPLLRPLAVWKICHCDLSFPAEAVLTVDAPGERCVSDSTQWRQCTRSNCCAKQTRQMNSQWNS